MNDIEKLREALQAAEEVQRLVFEYEFDLKFNEISRKAERLVSHLKHELAWREGLSLERSHERNER